MPEKSLDECVSPAKGPIMAQEAGESPATLTSTARKEHQADVTSGFKRAGQTISWQPQEVASMSGYYYPRQYGCGPGRGWGRGPGGGFGRGYGGGGWCRRLHGPWCQGWGPPAWAPGPYEPGPYWQEVPYESPQEEVGDLKEQEGALRGRLEAIQKRLGELEKEALAP